LRQFPEQASHLKELAAYRERYGEAL
jgi:hypothetical protein